ncbi:PREDICTED: ectonucleoside triphosphate diphosphohydrolase 8 isoform X4 [Ceratotherium simum simum]|uniref:Ectonucleoside triphosphate diphosphohydrolase 8 n=1 Tax=Ceratotherium simum simum TaxID=73337 RepID=A0ABM1CE78_CERSS|nr:PREDICTED: ectonucleoside triphosphate diphosphohydrolase 8 isoform X4 [Ceratotherium simum simum]
MWHSRGALPNPVRLWPGLGTCPLTQLRWAVRASGRTEWPSRAAASAASGVWVPTAAHPPAGASPAPTMGLTWKERVLTALLGAAAASGLTTLILILVEATNVLLPADTKFGIVFDAGSSHTSLFVYQWPADKENNTGVVSQVLACQVEGPGISSYTSDPAQAGESLQGCLEEALALIPEAQHQETPMFLGATAGMRLLSQKNSSQARDIFVAVTRVLSQSPVDFRGAELLAGQDEGALGWITINYVLGMLVKYSFSGEWIRPPEGTLVGALDMGGASTQLTFVPGGPILHKNTQATLRLYGYDHSIYTHSYLCFGRDQMLNRLLAGLVQAFSNFHYTFHFLNLTSRQPLATVNASVWEFCQRPWKLVEASSPGQDRWLRDYCASGLYILTLLLEGYGFSEDTWPSIEFRKQAGGTDIGWTLGYMLNLTNMVPAEAPAQWRAESYNVWVAGVVFMVLTLVAVLGAAAVQLLWPQD